jgi:putative FmdB family regulatory protein
MPTYEYLCKDCNHEFTVFLSINNLKLNQKSNALIVQSDNVQKKISAFITQNK